MRAWRFPAILLLVALLVAGIVVDRRDAQQAAAVSTSAAAAATPRVPSPGALSATWYCAGGSATGDDQGPAEQVVHIANASGQALKGRASVYPSDGAVVTRELDLPALSRVDLRVSDVVKAPNAAVLVEVDGGEVAVQHEVTGPTGRAIGACASSPSSQWYFPAGTTRPGTTMTLSLFNPFPSDAVVDVRFESEDGARTPQNYQGMVVPGGRVVALDVSGVVTLRNELATIVTARSGRVVADQVQTAAGQDDFPRGLSVTLGAPVPSVTWLFPDGIGADGYDEAITVYNADSSPAEVEVQVLVDDPDLNGVAEPFEVTVQPSRYAVIDVFGDGRVPVGVGHAAVVRARNGVRIVAERTIAGGPNVGQPGLSYTIAAPVVASRWLAATGATPGESSSALIVFNPSPTATVSFAVRAIGDGTYQSVEGLDAVTLPPGVRTVIDLGDGGLGLEGLALEVESDAPVVVEARFGLAQGDDLSYLMATPVTATLSAPSDDVGDLLKV